MNWLIILGLSIIIYLIILVEWKKLDVNQSREKIALLSLSILGWIIGVILTFFPNIPGPTQFIDWLFKPLGEFLK